MSDTHGACMNFVNALEKIPGIIAQYEERTAKLKADVPLLEAIIAKPWGKEGKLLRRLQRFRRKLHIFS